MSRTLSDTSAGHLQNRSQIKALGVRPRCPAFRQYNWTPSVQNASGVRLLDLIRDKGGVLIGGQRSIARTLGWSKSRLHDALHDLAHAGLVKLTTGKSGTVVQLVPVAA